MEEFSEASLQLGTVMVSCTPRILTRPLIPGSSGHSPKGSAPAKLCAHPRGLSLGSVCAQLWAETSLSARFPAPTAAWPSRGPERCRLGTGSQPGWSPGRPGRRLSPQLQPCAQEAGVWLALQRDWWLVSAPTTGWGCPSTWHHADLHVSATHPSAPAGPAWEKPTLLTKQTSSQSGVTLTKHSPRR